MLSSLILFCIIFLFFNYNNSIDKLFKIDIKILNNSYGYSKNQTDNEIARIHVGEIPTAIDINSNTNMIYVANSNSNFISVINGSNNKVFNINLTESVSKLAINSLQNIIYAVGENAKAILIINGSTNKEMPSIPIGDYPNDIDINEKENLIYTTFEVTNFNSPNMETSGFVSVINATINKVIKNIQVGTSPSAIAVNPITNMIYVANNDYSKTPYNNTNSIIYAINGTNNKVVSNISVVIEPYDLTINKQTNMVYVINEDANRISVINGKTNKLEDTIVIKGSYSPLGIRPSSIAINPTTNTIYTVNTGSNKINVLNTSTYQEGINSIAAQGSILSSVAVNPNTNTVYVTDQGANIVYVLGNETKIISRDISEEGSEENHKTNNVGLKLDEKPKDIAIDYRLNKIYVIYENSKKIDEIDGMTNKISTLSTKFNTSLVDIDVNSNTHFLYAISENEFNVIDTKTHDIKSLELNGTGSAINVNSNANKIYFTRNNYMSSDILYEIDGVTNQLIRSIPVSLGFLSDRESIGINPNIDTIYISNNRGLSVIEGSSNHVVSNISVNTVPFSRIAVNTNNDMVYVANENSRLVYVIDGYTRKVQTTIDIDGYPKSITVNPSTNLVYVANDISGFVSVINATNNKVIKNIQVGTSPSAIAVNSNTNMIYVANLDSQIISIINGLSNEIAIAVVFDIVPPNSGHILCDSEEVITNDYIFIDYKAQCKAKPNIGFEFSSWIQNLDYNSIITISSASNSSFWYTPIVNWFKSSTNTLGFQTMSYDAATFNVNKYGNFTANFNSVPSPIPTEYWTGLYTIVISSIIGWFIPSIVGSITTKRQLKKVDAFHRDIIHLYDDKELNEKDIGCLDNTKRDISNAYARGKISKEHYDNLNNNISILYQEIFMKKIQSIDISFYDQSDKLKKIDDELNMNLTTITKAYNEGKINREQFDNIKEEISIMYEEILKNKIDRLTNEKEKVKLLEDIKNKIDDLYSKKKINEKHYNLLNKILNDYKKYQI